MKIEGNKEPLSLHLACLVVILSAESFSLSSPPGESRYNCRHGGHPPTDTSQLWGVIHSLQDLVDTLAL